MPVHPNVESMGDRKLMFLIQKSTLKVQILVMQKFALKDLQILILMGLRPIMFQPSAVIKDQLFTGFPEDSKIEACLIFPDDGKLTRIHGVLEKNNYDIGTTLQLERIGYGIMIDKSTILFTHE